MGSFRKRRCAPAPPLTSPQSPIPSPRFTHPEWVRFAKEGARQRLHSPAPSPQPPFTHPEWVRFANQSPVPVLKVEHHLVDEAPAPAFAGLERAHHRMMGVLEVFGGVPVGRRIAATDVTAGQAEAQVDPGGAGL